MRNALPATPASQPATGLKPYPSTVAEAYNSVLFHGEDFQALAAIEGLSADAIVGLADRAAARRVDRRSVAEFMAHGPAGHRCCFPACDLLGRAQKAAPNLPVRVASYRQYRRGFPPGEIRISVRITKVAGHLIHADIEFSDGGGALIVRMDDAEFVSDPHLTAAFRNNQLAAAV